MGSRPPHQGQRVSGPDGGDGIRGSNQSRAGPTAVVDPTALGP